MMPPSSFLMHPPYTSYTHAYAHHRRAPIAQHFPFVSESEWWAGRKSLNVCEILPNLFLGDYTAAMNKSFLKRAKIARIVLIHNTLQPAFPEEFLYSIVRVNDLPYAPILNEFPRCFKFIDEGLIGLSPVPQSDAPFFDTSTTKVSSSFSSTSGSSSIACPFSALAADTIARDPAISIEDIASSAPFSFSTSGDGNPNIQPVLVHCAKGISRSASFIIGYLMYACALSYKDAFAFVRQRRLILPNLGFQMQLQRFEEFLLSKRPVIEITLSPEDTIALQKAIDKCINLDDQEKLRRRKYRKRPIFLHVEGILEGIEMIAEICTVEWIHGRIQEFVRISLDGLVGLVDSIFKNSSLLRERSIWEPYGLIFQNLKGYAIKVPADLLEAAVSVQTKLQALKNVFSPSLPGMQLTDAVLTVLKEWLILCNSHNEKLLSEEIVIDYVPDNPKKKSHHKKKSKSSNKLKSSSKHKSYRKKHSKTKG
ncbi:dual specificity phosphatase, catalytic domain-containing protein [Cardiosporidium cionae]|uniref:protein-tyrosine-phosphatase n=1 Tax=Cardiosporidium cionae TaxID=476202 RepID=A0ABQ7JCM7_9APIC|nr:dual specificity phosphatase, catalytic domain-containing protein [Cardiosporidium cionae]|eukprot:KAF8821703.1 dual specificity phosphatase, catalytic domain-containing protein [Cardiosporidium cionae]